MRYREQLGFILMRDKGPRHSYHMRMSHFIALLVFFASMPALCAILAWQCAELWDQNKVLRANVGRFEADAQLAQARAERLAYLEELLNQASVPARDIILRRLASGNAPPQEVAPETAEPNLHEEGPGHEEFTVLDNGRVKISNVQVKRVGSNGLRIGLDLRNPDNEKMLAGEISVTLLTADGQKIPLIFDPLESGSFRINRFKRATMISHPGRNISLGNSQVIVEVKDAEDTPLYRNVYAVQQ